MSTVFYAFMGFGGSMNTIGERIKAVRKFHKLSQSSFAEIIGISQTHISKIESDLDNPSDKLLNIISSEFDIDFKWLKSGIGNMQNIKENSNIQLKDWMISLRAFLNNCSEMEYFICAGFLLKVPELFGDIRLKPKDNYLIILSGLLNEIIKYNNYLKSEKNKKYSAKDMYSKKVDEIMSTTEFYRNKINSYIEQMMNLYLGDILE